MANRLQRFFNSFQRARVAKYDSTSIAAQMGINGYGFRSIVMNETNSMAIAAVYACVGKISSSLAAMPMLVMRRGVQGSEPARNSNVQALLNQPGEYCTAYEFFESLIAQACMYGCGYAEIIREQGQPVQLKLLNYYQVKPLDDEYSAYELQDGRILRDMQMLVICNMERMSPIRLHAQNIGLAKAAENYGMQYFSNGGQMTGVLSTEQPLKNEQIETIQQSWNNSGTNAGTKLLPFGFRYNRIGIPPEEAQFIETRKFQAEEICRIFSVPPALVQLESQTTYNNVEQQNLMFRQHTLLPWVKRIEQELDRKLIVGTDIIDHYIRLDMDSMYRADNNSRAQFYKDMLQSGVMSINEVRAREDLNPVAGGDVHTVQVNQIALDRLEAYSDNISKDGNGSTEA
jgi:HK97 family phage portal protein